MCLVVQVHVYCQIVEYVDLEINKIQENNNQNPTSNTNNKTIDASDASKDRPLKIKQNLYTV